MAGFNKKEKEGKGWIDIISSLSSCQMSSFPYRLCFPAELGAGAARLPGRLPVVCRPPVLSPSPDDPPAGERAWLSLPRGLGPGYAGGGRHQQTRPGLHLENQALQSSHSRSVVGSVWGTDQSDQLLQWNSSTWSTRRNYTE